LRYGSYSTGATGATGGSSSYVTSGFSLTGTMHSLGSLGNVSGMASAFSLGADFLTGAVTFFVAFTFGAGLLTTSSFSTTTILEAAFGSSFFGSGFFSSYLGSGFFSSYLGSGFGSSFFLCYFFLGDILSIPNLPNFIKC